MMRKAMSKKTCDRHATTGSVRCYVKNTTPFAYALSVDYLDIRTDHKIRIQHYRQTSTRRESQNNNIDQTTKLFNPLYIIPIHQQ